MKRSSLVLVLDKNDYKKKEQELINICKNYYNSVRIVYTEYEDNVIRLVRGIRFIGNGLQHLCYWSKSYNYAKKIYLSCKTKDYIICFNPIVGMFLGKMNAEQKVNLTVAGFLFSPKKNKLYYSLRKKIVLKQMQGINSLIVYASHEVDYYKKIFPSYKGFKFVPYGIDYDQDQKYSGKHLPEKFFFSGGGSNRDYETLLRGYNLAKKETEGDIDPLVIATLPYCVAGLDMKNAILLEDVTLETFGNVMGSSKALILSLKDINLSAGHQVLLQAMKLGVPVIVNRIDAIEDYVDSSLVTFYKSGDYKDLAKKIIEFNKFNKSKPDKKLKAYYQNKYTFNALLKRTLDLVD